MAPVVTSEFQAVHLGSRAEHNPTPKELSIAGNQKLKDNYTRIGSVLAPAACTNARGTEMKAAGSTQGSQRHQRGSDCGMGLEG